MFKIGDHVSFLDDDISGVVTAINGTKISLETTDGFVVDAGIKELILEESFEEDDLYDFSLRDVLREKTQNSRPVRLPQKKEKTIPPMEVDLHIHHLTSSERGMTSHDKLNLQMDAARRQLEFAIKKRIQRVVFIHGVGEGVLRTELEYLFSRYAEVKFYDADYQKYGLGATEVFIFQTTSG